MHAPSILIELLLLIAAAAAGVALFERLRLPAIAGFLAAGATLGPAGLGLVQDSERVRELAEFGVVFLLFEIGLELPVDLLRRVWRTVLVAGALQVAGTIACVAALAIGFGVDRPSAFVLGGLVAMSSTALVMRLLSARGELDAPHGHLSVGILLFQDLCIVPLLLVIPLLAGGVAPASWPQLRELLQAVVLFLLLVIVTRSLLPRVVGWAATVRSGDLLSLVAFLIVLGFAVAGERLGLTLAIGAFTAGLLLGASPYAPQLFAEVAPVRGVLLGIFFTAVGMLFDPAVAFAAWPSVVGYVGAVVLLKTAIIVLAVGFVLRRGLRLALLTGLGLAQTGEFSFVLGEVGRQQGLLSPALHQVFVAGSIVTLMATPFLFRVAPRLARFAGAADRVPARFAAPTPARGAHVVIIGFGLAGQTLARVLAACDVSYVVLEANPVSVAEARSRGEPILFGDATRPAILERLDVARARLVTIAISDPAATRRCVAMTRALAPGVEILVRTRYVAEVDVLSEAGADVVVVEEFEATIDMLSAVLRAFGFAVETITRFSEQMREEGYEVMRAPPALALDPWLAELLGEAATEWMEVPAGAAVGRSLAELDVHARSGASILAVERAGGTTSNPAPAFVLAEGDRLLVVGTAENLRRAQHLLR